MGAFHLDLELAIINVIRQVRNNQESIENSLASLSPGEETVGIPLRVQINWVAAINNSCLIFNIKMVHLNIELLINIGDNNCRSNCRLLVTE